MRKSQTEIINKVLNEDCLDYLKRIDDQSVDLILIDPPYNELPKTWDNFKSWAKIKPLFKKILKNNGQLYIFGKQPMLSDIYAEFKEDFKFRFELVWNKNKGMWSSNSMPMRSHELIWCFCKKETAIGDLFFDIESIKTPGEPYIRKNKITSTIRNNWKANHTIEKDGNRFPLSVINQKQVIRRNVPRGEKHPTEKPLPILEWIVKSSCPEDGLVLDCFMGSGSTALAAKANGRNFLGCEIDSNYHKLANKRIKETLF